MLMTRTCRQSESTPAAQEHWSLTAAPDAQEIEDKRFIQDYEGGSQWQSGFLFETQQGCFTDHSKQT